MMRVQAEAGALAEFAELARGRSAGMQLAWP